MVLRHVGLECRTEENADRFYRDLLRLEKSEAKVLPASLSKSVFNLDTELVCINYRNENLHFEVFITDHCVSTGSRIGHICLEVADGSDFLVRCNTLGVEVARIPKGDKILIFIRDFDGNLFEIKEFKQV